MLHIYKCVVMVLMVLFTHDHDQQQQCSDSDTEKATQDFCKQLLIHNLDKVGKKTLIMKHVEKCMHTAE